MNVIEIQDHTHTHFNIIHICLSDRSDEEKVCRNSWNQMTASLTATDLSITDIIGIIIFIFKFPNGGSSDQTLVPSLQAGISVVCFVRSA